VRLRRRRGPDAGRAAVHPAEGAELLAASGGGWLPEQERQDLVARVDGHALAVAVLGAILADRPPTADLAGLRASLTAATGTNVRVAKVLNFYATRLTDADRYLVAAVRDVRSPGHPAAVLSLAGHEAFGGRLDGWTDAQVEAAARDRLAGLLSGTRRHAARAPAGPRGVPAAGAGARPRWPPTHAHRHARRADRQPGGRSPGRGGDRVC
jgi:hypothetical protein